MASDQNPTSGIRMPIGCDVAAAAVPHLKRIRQMLRPRTFTVSDNGNDVGGRSFSDNFE